MPLPEFADDSALLDWVAGHLTTALLSDACDAEGHRHQALAADIRPLDPSKVLAGRARTLLWEPIDYVPERPYDSEIEAVDSLRKGDVFVMSVNRSPEIVPWGELLTTAMMVRGGRGAVLDGLVRDSAQIQRMGLPVFCTGRRPLDSCGRGIVSARDVAIQLGSVTVHSGDLVVGDADGVIIVPRAIEAGVLDRAWTKASGENATRDALRAGRSLAEVFEELGIL